MNSLNFYVLLCVLVYDCITHKLMLFSGLLYAVGGYDGASRHCLSSVECYNPEADTWTPVADMSCRRSGAGKLKQKLYFLFKYALVKVKFMKTALILYNMPTSCNLLSVT